MGFVANDWRVFKTIVFVSNFCAVVWLHQLNNHVIPSQHTVNICCIRLYQCSVPFGFGYYIYYWELFFQSYDVVVAISYLTSLLCLL